jgi:hypothetical protein
VKAATAWNVARDMIAFRLEPLSPDQQDTISRYNAVNDGVIRVTDVHSNAPWRPNMNLKQGNWFLVQLQDDRLSADGKNRAFAKWFLTQQTKLSRHKIRAHSLYSGRSTHATYDQQ